VRRTLVFLAVLAVVVGGVAVFYQITARERDYRGLLARGDAALQTEQTFGAIEAYSGAVALRPDSMLAHLRRGETYLRRGELEAAERDFQTASALDPTATRPLDELGDVRYLRQRFQPAIEAYQQCLRLDDRLPRVSYKLALAQYKDGNLEGALIATDEALRVSDRMADVHYLRGLCFRDQRRFAQAQQALERAVALSPGMIAAREELAELYGSVGRHADELEQLQVLAGLDRDHIERHIAIGLAHARWWADSEEDIASRAGHAELAVLTLRSALERTADQLPIYSALGRVWLDIAQARQDPSALNKAVEWLERVGASTAATSEALTLYGRALLESGRVDVAERALQQATERYPVQPAAFWFYATAAEQQKHLDVARQALLQYNALTADQSGLAIRASRIAALSSRLNDFKTAAEWFERALTATPNDRRLFAPLAEAQLKAGDQQAARATIARGLEKDPDNAPLLALTRRAGFNKSGTAPQSSR
jgi:tetratricopeptide (TPR) repeat protein